jgi:hypothetical protein
MIKEGKEVEAIRLISEITNQKERDKQIIEAGRVYYKNDTKAAVEWLGQNDFPKEIRKAILGRDE